MRRAHFVEEGDCYQVDRLDGDQFLVQHYPDRATRVPCCQLRIRVTDADRARAIPDVDPHGEAACLHRAYLACERRHAHQQSERHHDDERTALR